MHAIANRTRASCCVVLAILLFCIACDRGDAGRVEIPNDEAAVPRVVISDAPAWDGHSAWSVGAEPAFVLGEPGRGPELFRVRDVVVMGSGNIAVANSGSDEVFVYDSAGEYLYKFGGNGEGPGEIPGLLALFGCRGNTLVTVSSGRRVRFFSPTGTYLRGAMVEPPDNATGIRVEDVSDDCDAVLLKGEAIAPPPGRGEVGTNEYSLHWSDVAGAGVQLVARFPGMAVFGTEVIGRLRGVPVPWGSFSSWSADGGSVAVGTSAEFEIQIFDSTGLSEVVRWKGRRVPISDADRRSYEEARRRRYQEVPPPMRPLFPRLDAAPVSDVRPTLSRMLFDDQGNLWVQEYPTAAIGRPWQFSSLPDGEPERWWAFDPARRLLGSIWLPPGLEVRAIANDYVVGVWKDELGVETVRAYRLIKPESD